MTSSNVPYFEDLYTLKEMIESFEGSEQLIREIQKHGLMLPEIVKFGSQEIEIYCPFDRNIGRHIKEALEEHCGFTEALASAQAHVVEVYRVANGATAIDVGISPDPARLPSTQRVKKLLVLGELLEALDLSEETFQEIRQHIRIVPMRLLIPGNTIEYYFEDDYLRLRYIVTLVGEGCPLEEAAGVAYDWGMSELW